jgi:hypothetical protein
MLPTGSKLLEELRLREIVGPGSLDPAWRGLKTAPYG